MYIIYTNKNNMAMKRILFTLLVLVLLVPATSAQNPLMIKYEREGATGGIGILPSQSTEAMDVVVRELKENSYALVLESRQGKDKKYHPRVAWIYLNDIDNPTDFEDASYIESDYLGTINLFCINLSWKLRMILKFKGIKGFFNAIGVEYYIDQNGDVISIIDYDKLEKFV